MCIEHVKYQTHKKWMGDFGFQAANGGTKKTDMFFFLQNWLVLLRGNWNLIWFDFDHFWDLNGEKVEF